MRKISVLFVFLCLTSILFAQSQDPVSHFAYPAINMPDDWQYYRANGTGDYRTFFYDANHLGADIDLEEETAVYAILPGKMKIYRSSSGYGELVAVVETALPSEMAFINAIGEVVTTDTLITIYGHIRNSELRDGTPDVSC